jgi:rRNA maturation protein Nop10
MKEKETAIQNGQNVYQIINDICSVCGRRAPWRYVHNDKCQSCCANQAADLYNVAVSAVLLNANKSCIEYRPDRLGRSRPARKIDNDELQTINECLQLTGEKADIENQQYYPSAITPETATARNLPVYLSPHYCIERGHVGVKTLTGKCYFCQQEKANSPRQQAIRTGNAWYTPIDPCPRCGTLAPRAVHDGRCSGCNPGKRSESPRQTAQRLGNAWYTPTDPCPRCGKTAPRRVNNGQCSGCTGTVIKRQPDSPRQQAIRTGNAWYNPIDPCPRCGKTAPRRVNNGQCSGCTSSTSQWIIEHPDMIITREMAAMLGIEVYREDIATGWKWVATGIKIK